ncbi:MAG TPA: 2-hydroxy-3-oxopropionate reductase [Polyangiaceae bacterium]|nr:2-hydroxy-3-oxopropionate reductase [Polyangiaceae bacterium]
MVIGFIGVGIMGLPMAGHLQAAGHNLLLCRHRSPLPESLLGGGASECKSLKEVAQRAELIITMLPDTPDVERALFAPEGIASGLTPGKTVIDMSSVSPIATKDFAARIVALGCDDLDAPVSGGQVGAQNASLTIMVGGDPEAFERVRPLLALMGKNITRVGDVGAGQTCKVANQIIVALNIQAVAEALLFAAKAGADPVKVREALMGGFAASRVLEVHGERMIRRTFEPGFRIELHGKDLDLALSGARALRLALPNTATAQQLFNACRARGAGGWDHSAMVTALEALAGYELGASVVRG